MFCNKCGAEIKGDAKFCAACGTPVSAPVTPEQQPAKKSRIPLIIGIAAALVVAAVVVGVVFFMNRGIAIDEKHFSEEEMRTALQSYDLNGNNRLSKDEIEAVTNLTFTQVSAINNLHMFTHLERLTITSPNLMLVDVSDVESLKVLDCTGCHQLEEVTFGNNSSLTTVRLRDTALKQVDISATPHIDTLELENTTTVIGLGNSGLEAYWIAYSFDWQDGDSSYTNVALYDAHGRVESVSEKNAMGTAEYAVKRNEANHIVSLQDGADGYYCEWDDNEQITRNGLYGAGLAITYAYNDEGLLVDEVHEHAKVHYEYNNEGKLTAYTNHMEGLDIVCNFTYNNQGQLVKTGNSGDLVPDTTYTYDDKGRCVGIEVASGDGVSESHYVYDEQGKLTSATQINPFSSYYLEAKNLSYDKNGLLTNFTVTEDGVSSKATIGWTRVFVPVGEAPQESIVNFSDVFDPWAAASNLVMPDTSYMSHTYESLFPMLASIVKTDRAAQDDRAAASAAHNTDAATDADVDADANAADDADADANADANAADNVDAEQQPAPTNPSFIDNSNDPVQVTGTVVRKKYTPEEVGMAWGATVYYLELDEPVTFSVGEGYGDFGNTTCQLSSIMVGSAEGYPADDGTYDIDSPQNDYWEPYVGQIVTVEGSLFPAQNAHQFTEIIISGAQVID